ncbi:MAG: cyanophycin synthetase, partial [Rhizobacter sp.]
DLEDLDEVSSADLPGFTDRLVELVPTLIEHRCSEGHRGGFIERLRMGTYPAHIAEHLTLALQNLAGHDVGYGKARSVHGVPRHYRVVMAYRSERVVERALELAIAMVEALAKDEPFDVAAAVEELRSLAARDALGPSTQAIVDAARRRDIPVFRLSDGNLFQLGWGVRQQRIQATTTSQTNYIAVSIASDKELTKALLAEAGLPVPKGRTVETLDEAHAAARRIGGPVVVKPLDGNQGKGVSTAVVGEAALAVAFERASAYRGRLIVESFIEGDDYRVLVIGNQVVAAARRRPPEVTGDGQATVRQLVDRENERPGRGEGHENVLTRIRLDDAAAEELARQSLHFDAVPEPGRLVRLRGNANLSTGGTAEDVTAELHPDTARACVSAAEKIGLDVAGIDIVCRDIRRPLAEQHGAVIEVNAAPGIRMHEHPSRGERHHVGEAICRSLFPPGNEGRIPVVAITGSNGKTTTTLAVAHVLQRLGRTTGVATTEGVFVDGQRVAEGDCTGYWSARTVLTSPKVEVAVLETARGGILKRGLAFDASDVGVVLNVQPDHLGQDGIDTIEDLADVKSLVAETARKTVVLNADDPHCVAMAQRRRKGGEAFFFSMDSANPTMTAHLEAGGRGVYLHGGILMLGHGYHRVPLVEAARLPFTLGGRARHQVQNALAAFAALIGLGIAHDHIAAALASFTSGVLQNPLRLNLFRTRGVTLLVDYAHNEPAYRAIIDTARSLTTQRMIGVVTVPGDRRDEDLAAVGRLCAEGFDELVIYEMDEYRGRDPGATARVLEAGARQSARGKPLRVVLDVRDAMRCALERAQPGDVVVVGCASHLSDLKSALEGGDPVFSVDAAGLRTLSASDAAVEMPEEEELRV